MVGVDFESSPDSPQTSCSLSSPQEVHAFHRWARNVTSDVRGDASVGWMVGSGVLESFNVIGLAVAARWVEREKRI